MRSKAEALAAQAVALGARSDGAYAPDPVELDILAAIGLRASKATDEYLAVRALYETRIRSASLSTDQSMHLAEWLPPAAIRSDIR